MTVIEQSRESLRAGIAAKLRDRTWLTYEYQRHEVRGSLALRIIDGNVAGVHQRLRALVLEAGLPRTGWWSCTRGPR